VNTPSLQEQIEKVTGKLVGLPLEAEKESQTAQQIAETAQRLFSATYVAVLKPDAALKDGSQPLAASAFPPSEERRQWWSKLIARAMGREEIVTIKDPCTLPEDATGFTQAVGINAYATVLLRPTNSHTTLAILQLEWRDAQANAPTPEALAEFAAQATALLQRDSVLRLTESLQAQTGNAEDGVKKLVDWMRAASSADILTIFSYNEDLGRFDDVPYLSGLRRQPAFYRPSYYRKDDLAQLAAKHRYAEFATNSDDLYGLLNGPANIQRAGNFNNREEIASVAALPLLAECKAKSGAANQIEELVGILFFNFRQPQPFDSPQRELLLSLARFAAQAIQLTRDQSEAARRHARELKLLEEIDDRIRGDWELEDLLYEILKLAQAQIPKADHAAILLRDQNTDELRARAVLGGHGKLRIATVISLQGGDRGIIRWACTNKTPARVANVKDEEWGKIYTEAHPLTVSEMDVPLFDGDQVIGALNLESHEPAAFSVADLDFLITISNRVVLAIKKAQTKEREEAVNDLLKISREILTKESSATVLETILNQVLTLTTSAHGAIFLYDARWDDLHLAQSRGILEAMRHRRVRKGEGVVHQVMESKTAHIADVSQEPWRNTHIRFFEGEPGWQLSVPILKNQNDVRGVIVIERPSSNRFTKEEQALVEQMADLAETALRNAEHYEMREQLDALHEVDLHIIQQADDPEAVLGEILVQALRLTEAEQGDLHLYRDGKPHTTYFVFKDKDSKQATRCQKIVGQESEEIKRGVVKYVAENLVAYRTGEDAQTDPLAAGTFDGNIHIHSEIAVPLLDGDKLLGVLNLESVEYDDLTESDVELMRLLAGQAVIAYQNALRFRQEKEATQRFQTLRDVGKKLSEITTHEEIEQAYRIVLEPLEKLSPGRVNIRRYDEHTRNLTLVWHFSAKDQGSDAPHPLGEGVSGYLAEQWLSGEDRSGKAIVIADVRNLPSDIHPKPGSDKVRSLVSAPIFFKEKYYGSLSLSHGTVDYFSGADVDLIEGLAEQLGVTLHRLDVTREKQEAELRNEEDKARAKRQEAMAHHAANVAHRYANTFMPVLNQARKLQRLLRLEKAISTEIQQSIDEFIIRASKASKLNKQFKEIADEMTIGILPDEALERVDLLELLEDVIADFDFPDGKSEENLSMEVEFDEDDAEKSSVDGKPQVQYKYEYRIDGKAEIKVVSEQIKTVLTNLIGNAREVMPEGGRLTFKVRHLEKHVELRVTDSGPGISEEIRPRIFEFGFSTKKSTGFGLAIAQYYVGINGGELKLDDTHTGPGATFVLLLLRADHPRG